MQLAKPLSQTRIAQVNTATLNEEESKELTFFAAPTAPTQKRSTPPPLVAQGSYPHPRSGNFLPGKSRPRAGPSGANREPFNTLLWLAHKVYQHDEWRRGVAAGLYVKPA